LRFYADQIAINSTFGILFTAFRDRGAGKSNSCSDSKSPDSLWWRRQIPWIGNKWLGRKVQRHGQNPGGNPVLSRPRIPFRLLIWAVGDGDGDGDGDGVACLTNYLQRGGHHIPIYLSFQMSECLNVWRKNRRRRSCVIAASCRRQKA